MAPWDLIRSGIQMDAAVLAVTHRHLIFLELASSFTHEQGAGMGLQLLRVFMRAHQLLINLASAF